METALARNDSVSEFVCALGLKMGVSGYALHVVPVALYAWLRYRETSGARSSPRWKCGGDTDTVGAILGAAVRRESRRATDSAGVD